MTKFLLRHCIKNHGDVNNPIVRRAYSTLAGFVGIICNLFLFAVKLIIGLITNSVSITTDSFNNLSDVGSAAVVIIGARFGSMPADEDHPFGHGRTEYICSLIISFIILFVGIQFLRDSITKIISPEQLRYNALTLPILFISILIKLWLSSFNNKLGKTISSGALTATGLDSLSDVLATSATVISILLLMFFKINIDGYIGCLVSGFVIFAGYKIAQETVSTLLGKSANHELAHSLETMVLSYDKIIGVHDLIIHNYGPGRSMASIHAEVPDDLNIHTIHDIIDLAEREISERLGISIVIHMDPVDVNDKQAAILGSLVDRLMYDISPELHKHDFRVTKNSVVSSSDIELSFDVVVPYQLSDSEAYDVIDKLQSMLRESDPRYKCVVNIDRSYVKT